MDYDQIPHPYNAVIPENGISTYK